MPLLYRVAITITRKTPYIDWANSLGDDSPELTADLARQRRTVYLAPDSDEEPELRSA